MLKQNSIQEYISYVGVMDSQVDIQWLDLEGLMAEDGEEQI